MSSKISAVAFHPGSELYGADRMFLETLLALSEADISCTFVTPSSGRLTELAAQKSPGSIHIEDASLFVLRKQALRAAPVRSLGAFVHSVFRQTRMLRQSGADVVLANTVTLPATVLAARLANRPVIVHVHEEEPDMPAWQRALLLGPLRLAARVLVISGASLAFAVGENVRLSRKSHLLRNAVVPPSVTTDLPSDRPDVLRVLYLGRFSHRKGPDILLDALPLLEERSVATEARLVGDSFPGYEAYAERLLDLAESKGSITTAELMPFSDSVDHHLEWCHVVAVPSRQEPFGLVAVEAQMVGRLVIASDTGGLKEIITDGVTGWLVRPDSAAALADQLAKSIDEWDQTRQIAQRARGTASAAYSTSRYREQMALHVRATVNGRLGQVTSKTSDEDPPADG